MINLGEGGIGGGGRKEVEEKEKEEGEEEEDTNVCHIILCRVAQWDRAACHWHSAFDWVLRRSC